MLTARAQGAGDAGDGSDAPSSEQLEQSETSPATTHDGYRVVEPARPDLRPGESVTYVPDRYCVKCQQPRGIRKCSICGSPTVLREDLGVVQLPDLPPGAALELGVQTVPSTPAPAPARRRILEDVAPPSDPVGFDDAPALELGDLGERPELGAELEHELEAPPARGLLGRALAQRAERDRVEEEARKRSALLDHAQRQRAPMHAAGTNGTHQPQRTSILDMRGPEVTTITRLRGTAGRREAGGVMEREQRVLRDDSGREVQRTIGRSGKARSAEEQLIDLWEGAKVDKQIWTSFAAAYAKAGELPADAADSADALYMELIRRENLATARR